MNATELSALPEWPTGIGIAEREINGQQVRVPIAPPMAVMWHGDDDPMLIFDTTGQAWEVGWVKGVRYRRRHTLELQWRDEEETKTKLLGTLGEMPLYDVFAGAALARRRCFDPEIIALVASLMRERDHAEMGLELCNYDTPAFWEGHDDAVKGVCQRWREALDGKDRRGGVMSEPLESLYQETEQLRAYKDTNA